MDLSSEYSYQILEGLLSACHDAFVCIYSQNLDLQAVIAGKNLDLEKYDQRLSIGDSYLEVAEKLDVENKEEFKHCYLAALSDLKAECETVCGEEIFRHVLFLSCFGDEPTLCALVQNVSHEKKALNALRESESHLSVATQLAKIGYWELDFETLMFTFNDQFLNILKVSPEKLGGYQISAERYAREFLHEEDRPLIEYESGLARDTDDPNFSRYIEHRFINGDGQIGYLGVKYFVVKDDMGKTVKTVGANQDITERKLAEDGMRRLLHKTTEQNRKLKDFSFMISHNIRSSVANLLGLSQIIKESPQESLYLELLHTSVEELDKSIRSMSDILNFTNDEKLEKKEQCNVFDAVERFAELNRAWMLEKEVVLENQLPIEFFVESIPAYLDSILHNLIGNAIKYGINDQSKRILVGKIDDHTQGFYVRDFGDGLDLKKYASKLFNPGARFHRDANGQGIGLYMTKQQVEASGGRIAVESEVGKGSSFFVFLEGV